MQVGDCTVCSLLVSATGSSSATKANRGTAGSFAIMQRVFLIKRTCRTCFYVQLSYLTRIWMVNDYI